MIWTDILTASVLEFLFGALMGAPLGWLAGRKFAQFINRRRETRRRMGEPETHGDWGGIPTRAPGDEFYVRRTRD